MRGVKIGHAVARCRTKAGEKGIPIATIATTLSVRREERASVVQLGRRGDERNRVEGAEGSTGFPKGEEELISFLL